jgi:hypothetical protein
MLWVQVIAQPDERYESYCRGCDFIREHIFPGGHLPSMGAMVEAARGTQVRGTELIVCCWFGQVYDAGTSYLFEFSMDWKTHCGPRNALGPPGEFAMDSASAGSVPLVPCWLRGTDRHPGTHAPVPLLPQLSVVSVRDIGPDYAITLRAWRDAWRVSLGVFLALTHSQG